MPLYNNPYIIPYGVAVQFADSTGVLGPVVKIDSTGNTVFQQHPTNQQFLFEDKNGTALVTIDSGGHFILPNSTSYSAFENDGVTRDSLFRLGTTNNTEMLTGSGGFFTVIDAGDGNPVAQFATTTKIFKTYSGRIVERTAVSANYTVLVTDYIIAYTSTSSAFVATLPAAAAGNAGQTWIVKDESGGAATHNITVKTSGGTIDGVAAGTGKVINTNFGVLRVYSNGTNYFTF